MMNDYNDPKFWTKVPLEDIKTPKTNKMCVGQRFWAVTDDNCVLFFKGHSPQYNHSEAILKRIRPDCRVEYIEMAYVQHDCRDFV
jgi:hypothetical protein